MFNYRIIKLTPFRFRFEKMDHNGRILTAVEGSKSLVMETAIDTGLRGVVLGFEDLKKTGFDILEVSTNPDKRSISSSAFERFGVRLH